jgi:hypothetical protein
VAAERRLHGEFDAQDVEQLDGRRQADRHDHGVAIQVDGLAADPDREGRDAIETARGRQRDGPGQDTDLAEIGQRPLADLDRRNNL